MNMEEIFQGNRKKYMQVVRLMALIEGVNKSIQLSTKMGSSLEVKQYQHLKKKYTTDLINLLKRFDILEVESY